MCMCMHMWSVDVGVGTSTVGMGFVLLNMIAAVVERLMQRKLLVLEPVDLSKTAMLLLNNAFAIIPVAIAVPFAPTSLHVQRVQHMVSTTFRRLLFARALVHHRGGNRLDSTQRSELPDRNEYAGCHQHE